MTDPVDIRSAREARARRLVDARVDREPPDLVLEAWLDPEAPGQLCGSQLRVGRGVRLDSPASVRDAACAVVAGAASSALMLTDLDGQGVEGAWAADPVFVSALFRGGWTSRSPNQFWRREAESPAAVRLRAAAWVARAVAGSSLITLGRCLLLVLAPGRLRALPVE